MELRAYSGRVYRNFATSIESQELTDDLTENPAHRECLKKFFYAPNERARTPIERVLEKSEDQIIMEEIDQKFTPSNWYYSRYSDGTWPVLYAAESEETALKEALFHIWWRFYREELRSGPVPIERRVVALRVRSDFSVDFTLETDLDQTALTSEDESGYPYCQELARQALQIKTEVLRAPSARHADGICIPIFDKRAVEKDEGHLKYLKCTLNNDRTADVVPIIEGNGTKYQI